MDGMIGFGRWQCFMTFLLSFSLFTHMLDTGTEALMHPVGWWCKKPDFLQNWTNVEWILYSHSSASVSDAGLNQHYTRNYMGV